MPCSDSRDSNPVVYTKGHDPHYQQLSERLQVRCDMLTDLLCKTGKARYSKAAIPPEVLKWWREHCKIDEARGEPWDVPAV